MNSIKFQSLAVPAAVCAQPWRVTEIRKNRERLANGSHFVGNVLMWTEANRPVPPHVFKEAFAEPVAPREQLAAYEANTAAALDAYRAAQAARTPEQVAEQHAEARAAMGPGCDMVNVITGERYRT